MGTCFGSKKKEKPIVIDDESPKVDEEIIIEDDTPTKNDTNFVDDDLDFIHQFRSKNSKMAWRNPISRVRDVYPTTAAVCRAGHRAAI